MALSADRITQRQDPNFQSYPVKAATKIYAGSMVAVGADGFAIPAVNAANAIVVGVADKTVDNTAGADGALRVSVWRGVFLLKATSITQAMVGTVMYVVDDETFDDAVGAASIKAGRLIDYVSATSGWILIEPSGTAV
jgi:hypothetical protein